MRAEERKTGKIGTEVLTVGPGTGGNPVLGTSGNQPKYPGQKGSVRLPGRLGEKAQAQGSASSLPNGRDTAAVGGGDRQTRPRGQTQGDANVGGGDRQTLPCGSSGSDQVGPSRGSWAERGGQSESPSTESSESSGEEGPMAAAIEKGLGEIAEDEDEMWSQNKGAPLPTRNEADEDQGYQIGFDVLRSPWGAVYHLRRHCRHLRGPQVGPLTNYKWCQLCKRVAKNTRGRPPPGVTLLLSEQNDSCHTDERCPYAAGARPVRGCVNCREAEGVV